MGTISSTTGEKKKETTIPPRRGQVKGQIFESLVKAVVSMAARAGGGNSSEAGEASASATPPASSYNSDA